MTDDIFLRPGGPEEQVEARPDENLDNLGISELAYPEVLERAIAHASAARPGGGVLLPWTCMGPRNIGGRIVAIAQHPKLTNILYVGSAHGGLWRTIDQGDTWENIGQAQHVFPVGAIAVPAQANSAAHFMYVGTGSHKSNYVSGRGLYRVTTTGARGVANWERLTPAPGPHVAPAAATNGSSLRYTRIEVDPDNSNRFWTATQTGLWRGVYNPAQPVGARMTWTRDFPPAANVPANAPTLSAGPPPTATGTWPSYATDLRVVPDPTRLTEKHNGSIRHLNIFVAIQGTTQGGNLLGGVFRGAYDRQTDAVTWTPQRLPVPLPNAFGRVLLAVCRRRANHIYVVCEDNSGTFQQIASPVYRSNDSGANWQTGGSIPRANGYVASSGQADYDLVIEVNPDNPKIVLCGEIDLDMSTDSGVTFAPILLWQLYNTGDRSQHADQHVAVFDVADRRRVWAGNDGGLSVAPDIRGVPGTPGFWRKRSHGIIAGQFQGIASHSLLPNMTGGGLQDNGTWAGFGGRTWFYCGWADGGQMAINTVRPNEFHVTQNGWAWVNEVVPVRGNTGRRLDNRAVADLGRPRGMSHVRLNSYGLSGGGPFVGQITQDPRNPGQVMIGWTQSATVSLGFSAASPPAWLTGGSGGQTITVRITAAGITGTSRYTSQVGGGAVAAAAPTVGTTWLGVAANQLVAGPNVRIAFDTFAAAPHFVQGNSWIIPVAGGLAPPAAGNTSVGQVWSASAPTAATTVRITRTGTAGVAQYTWQQGANPVQGPFNVTNVQTFNGAGPAGPNLNMTVVFGIANYGMGDSWVIQPGGAVIAAQTNTSEGHVTVSVPAAGLGFAVGSVPAAGEQTRAITFGPPVRSGAGATTDGWIGTTVGNLYFTNNAPAGAFATVPTRLPRFGNVNRQITHVEVHPRDERIVAVASILSNATIIVQVTTAGVPPAARFAYRAGPGGAVVGPIATGANIVLQNAPILASFSAANFALNDTWVILPSGRSWPNGNTGGGNNTSAGVLTATQTSRLAITIAITTAGGHGAPHAVGQFTYQIGAAAAVGPQNIVPNFIIPNTRVAIAFANLAYAMGDSWTIAPGGIVAAVAGNTQPAGLTGVDREGGRVHLTYDQGNTWIDTTHAAGVPAAIPDLNALPPAPVTSLKFDLSGANLTLYAGTLAGVYRGQNLPTPTALAIAGPATIRVGQTVQLTANLTLSGIVPVQNHTRQVDWSSSNILWGTITTGGNASGHAVGVAVTPGANRVTFTARRGALSATHIVRITAAGAPPVAPPAAPAVPPVAVNVQWRPFNQRLPLVLVNDMKMLPHGRVLRIGTFGRGIWDCDLAGAPQHRLNIRQIPVEDGRAWPVTIAIVITGAGARGVAPFTWQVNGGLVSAPQLTAATFVVPGTQVVIGFAASPPNYAVGQTWTIAANGTVVGPAGRVTATLQYRTISALQNTDPRLPAAPAANSVGLDHTHAFDIRVDNAPFDFFDDRVDGAEFDELLAVDSPQRARPCAVYVQAHQAGTEVAQNVDVHLFFSASPAAPLGPPPGAAIPAALFPPSTFYNVNFRPAPLTLRVTTPGALTVARFTWQFTGGALSAATLTAASVTLPNLAVLEFSAGQYQNNNTWTIDEEGRVTPAPTNTSTGRITYGPFWRRVGSGPQRITRLAPEQPVVTRFDWTPPAEIVGTDVALCALCSGPAVATDKLPVAPAHATMTALIQNERRAALRIVPIQAAPAAELFIRDGIDDDARIGSTAFVARSPDIIVPHPNPAEPKTAFRDLLDPRPQDRLVAAQPNHIYVRVHNDGPLLTRAEVHLWAVPLDATHTPQFQTANWVSIASGVGSPPGPLRVDVPARSQALAHTTWTPPDPLPADALKAYALVALVRTTDNADPLPTTAAINTLADFWNLFGKAFEADNAAMRVLRYQT